MAGMPPLSVQQVSGNFGMLNDFRGSEGFRDQGFKTEVGYIAKPTTDDAVFCYWRRCLMRERATGSLIG